MPLPEPDYYSLEEFAQKWECTPRHLLHLGIRGQLSIAVIATGYCLETGKLERDKSGNHYNDDAVEYDLKKREILENYDGALCLLPSDLRLIEKYGETTVTQFRLDDWDYVGFWGKNRQRDIMVKLSQLVVTKEEAGCFALSVNSAKETTSERDARIIQEARNLLRSYYGTYKKIPNQQAFGKMLQNKHHFPGITVGTIVRVIGREITYTRLKEEILTTALAQKWEHTDSLP